MSIRSSAINLFPPLNNLELTIRRRSRTDPTLLNNSEMAAKGNGDLPLPDLWTMEELCQPSLNGRGGPIASIAIQATNFGLKNDMIQQVQNSYQFHGLPGDDANKHLDKFLHVTQYFRKTRLCSGPTDDANLQGSTCNRDLRIWVRLADFRCLAKVSSESPSSVLLLPDRSQFDLGLVWSIMLFDCLIGLEPMKSGNMKHLNTHHMSGNEDHHRQGRRFAVGGNGQDGRDPRDVEIERLRQRVRDLEIQHEIRQIRKRIRELELQREMRKETESRYVVRDDVNEEEEYPSFDSYPQSFEPIYPDFFSEDEPSMFTFDYIERNEGEKGLVEGDGPTVVTGGPVASMATLLFVPKVQRKDYEGPTTTSLDVLNSLSSKISTTKCIGAELFERFKLIAKSDRSNAPYDPGGTGLILGETTREVKLFRRVMVTLINGSRVDVPFDPVMENMDAYQDKDMGDVIFGKPFCRDACVEARRFNRFITIHNGNDNVTY
nr:reverse transcriptase domain-containing protein [Tanacetum cinerariifolium]